MPLPALAPLLLLAQLQSPAPRPAGSGVGAARAPVVPNDNRVPGGTRVGDTLRLELEARVAAWRPDPRVDSAVTVAAFAEAGGAPRIPAPLLRAAAGTAVHVRVRNTLDSTLVVHGLRAGTAADDTMHVAPGATREVRFALGAPGTYHYWGTTTRARIFERRKRDSQLSGAIVVDPPGVRPDPAERIFVMTVLDLYPEDSSKAKGADDLFDRGINGLAWPHSERLTYAVGDTVRWRWVNASYLPHPMHLHGFHFEVLSRGNGARDSTAGAGEVRLAVTEFMRAGSTFRMTWVPTRAGQWLMHCHMIPHITPFPARQDSTRAHDAHDVSQHPLHAMQGLVLGVTVADRGGAPRDAHVAGRASAPRVARRLRLFAQRAPADSGKAAAHGYVLQRDAEPRADSVEVPGTPLVVTRGETTAITVVNRLRDHTTVHWHGMELESVYDGVAGWSRTGGSVAPLVAPGDSFTVAFTPPRAGTFMYHTHMDESRELGAGMYGALLVLEPGERYDPATDHVFMIGGAVNGGRGGPAINGRHQPPPLTLRAGARHRLRLANILGAPPVRVRLLVDSTPATWRPRGKDGADLPASARAERPAVLRALGTGETYDFDWTPDRPLDAVLEVELEAERTTLRQPIRVR